MIKEIAYPCKFDCSMQSAMFYSALSDEFRPLVVALHTWSGDHTQDCNAYARYCISHDWNFIFPKFRGANWLTEGCGSDLVISDLEDAVVFMKNETRVDPRRIYLVGGSGGGHCALLMAGRRPDLWTAVSTWCPVSDIAAWHKQCLGTPCEGYSRHIESACGGNPSTSEKAGLEARKRSPLTWLPNASALMIDINTGIHDGHSGSVPVSQAINAYNILAAPEDRIMQDDIDFMVKNEKIPAALVTCEQDPAYGSHMILFRKQSRNVRLILFEGGHDILAETALAWLSKQASGEAPDWFVGNSIDQYENTELAK